MTKEEQHKKSLYEAIEQSNTLADNTQKILRDCIVPQLSSLGCLHFINVDEVDLIDQDDILMLRSVCENGLLYVDNMYRKREGLDRGRENNLANIKKGKES